MRRIDLDARVAKAAKRAGAELMEGFEVGTDVSLSKEQGLWTVKSTDVSGGTCLCVCVRACGWYWWRR